MIELIYESLYNTRGVARKKYLAKKLLDTLESKGMLPPIVEIDIQYTNGSAKHFVPRWEKE